MIVSKNFNDSKKSIYNWLIIGCLLIILMIVIGGITRITQSGLSMVKWEPIVGAIPPLNETDWQKSFDLYKKSPEFNFYNSHFTLSDYKKIFFWEYLHRLVARLIGLIFLIPFLFFWVKKYFSSKLKKQLLFILLLGFIQGLAGWLMVESGLSKNPHVSHYRLAIHLILALILLIYIYWVALSIKYDREEEEKSRLLKPILILFSLVLVQIVYGAFVAGLKAGKMYNTFPKLNNEWIPKDFDIIYNRDGLISLVNSPGIVQFIHRIIGITILVFAITIIFKIRNKLVKQAKLIYILFFLIFVQVILGIITLLYAVPLSLGVLHQVLAFLIVLCFIRLLYSFKELL
jgi:cytochrome c oxidase assembly protein subunit 15